MSELQERISKIKIIVMDSDGVLTDGGLWYSTAGTEPLIRFDIQDGLGIAAAKLAGMKFAIISGRPNAAVTQRAKDTGISEVLQGVEDKAAALREMAARNDWGLSEICFIGDDIKDLPPMEIAGLAIATQNAVPDVREAAHLITEKSGGHGAVREAIEIILRSQNKWQEALQAYIEHRRQ